MQQQQQYNKSPPHGWGPSCGVPHKMQHVKEPLKCRQLAGQWEWRVTGTCSWVLAAPGCQAHLRAFRPTAVPCHCTGSQKGLQ